LFLLALASCGGPKSFTLGIVCRDSPAADSATKLPPHFQEAELQTADALVRGLLEEGGLPTALGLIPPETTAPDFTLELFSQWAFEADTSNLPAETFVLSRTYLVPRAMVPEGRRDTSLAACMAGEEVLVPLRDLSAPGIALRVDGLSVGDEGYPLVWETRTRLAGYEEGTAKTKAGAAALGTELGALLRERLGAKAPPEDRPRLFWLAAAGDLMLGRGAGDILLKEGPTGIFGEEAAALLRSADLAIVNLEGSVSSRGSPVEKTFTFRFPPAMAGALRDAGIDGALLANNHVYDYGPEAFLDTLSHLERAGLGILGAGRNLEAAATPFAFMKAAGDSADAETPPVHAFGIASFPREASGWDGLSIAAGPGKPGILHAGRSGADKLKEGFSAEALDMVFFHGGNEWTAAPDARTRAIYADLARAGADIIIGSHPHIVQGFEWIEGKPVFWSLGNFVFAGMDNTGGGDEGLFVRLGFWGTELIYVEPYPLALSGPRTKIAPMENLKKFYGLSK
jgi:poly-gamma-glutamate synthesis protein (capsule biosynthesis protein)